MTLLTLLPFLHIFILQSTVVSIDTGSNIDDLFFEINIDRDNPQKLYKEFEEFIIKYKKNYKDEIEKKFRFEQFITNHNKIGEMNKEAKKAGHDTVYGINKFADRSKQEVHTMLSKFGPAKTNLPRFNSKNLRVKRQIDSLPKSLDLRYKKIGGRILLAPVKNQDSCSCCWAFAATALAEMAFSVRQKKMKILSDQEVCDCAARHGPGCSGGSPTEGLEYIKREGATSDENYPFDVNRSTVAGRCESEKHVRELDPYQLNYYSIDPFNAEYEITLHLYYFNIPIAVAFRCGKSLTLYTRGIIEIPDCDDEKEEHWHSGVIVGYGTSVNDAGRKVDYWIFRNSWDEDWGEAGYMRIVRGKDWCGIESYGTGAHIPE